MTPRLRGVRLLLTVLVTGIWLLASSSTTVMAHALLVRSTPEANAELDRSPASIEMWFSEPLEPGFSSARILDATGQEIPTGPIEVDPADPMHLTLPLSRLEPGIYTVAWQTLSQTDGHEWYGSFPFTVLNPDGSRPSTTAQSTTSGQAELPTPAEILARWLALLGGMVLFAIPLIQLVVVRVSSSPRTIYGKAVERDRRLAGPLFPSILPGILGGIAAVSALAGSWLQLLVQVLELGSVADLPRLLIATRTGGMQLTRQLLAVAIILVLLSTYQVFRDQARRQPRWYRPLRFAVAAYGAVLLLGFGFAVSNGQSPWAIGLTATGLLAVVTATAAHRLGPWKSAGPVQLSLVLSGLLLLAHSASSHAASVAGSVWAILGDWIHLLAAAAWLGGLFLLPFLLWQAWKYRDEGIGLHELRRFSYLAGISVFVLAITGLFSSLVELTSPDTLFTTTYGRVLLVKLLLVLLTLGIGFLNNWLIHRRPAATTTVEGLHRLRRQVGLEVGLGLLLMVSVAVLVQTPPPRSQFAAATSAQQSVPYNTVVQADDLTIHLQITPNQAGNNRFWVHLYHSDGTPIGEVQLVRLFFNYQDAQLGQAQVDLDPLGQDAFAAEGAFLSQAGDWDVSIYTRRRGLDDTLTDVTLAVPAATTATTDPWANPIPAVPAGILLGALLALVGSVPLLWYRPLRRRFNRRFQWLAASGGMLFCIGLVMGALSFPGLLNQTAAAAIPTATTESIDQGAALYQEHCAGCHGAQGFGDGPAAANLDPPPAVLPFHIPLHEDQDLYFFISGGISGTAMPAFEDTLSADEIGHLVNYLRAEFDSEKD